MQALHEYFELVAGTAATLLGLLFVSVSVNADIILDSAHRHATHLAEQAFHNYLAALVIALMIFFPGISSQSLSLAVLCLSVLYTFWLLIRFYQAMMRPLNFGTRIRVMRRYGGSLAGFASLIVGGMEMLNGRDGNTPIALGSLMLLVLATAVSWELLVTVAAERSSAQK